MKANEPRSKVGSTRRWERRRMIKSSALCVSTEHYTRHERLYPQNLILETWAMRSGCLHFPFPSRWLWLYTALRNSR